jgi:signal transduction histidine kinase
MLGPRHEIILYAPGESFPAGITEFVSCLSDAERLDIFGPDDTNLIVSDNGQGLESPDRTTAGAHFGLQGVRERVDKLGGLLNIDSTPGEGTRLAVMVPVRAAGVPARASGLW